MKKVIDLNSIARPINLNNSQEKLERRRKEILDTQEKLKRQAQDILKKK
jgi:hypothetical protein